MFQFNKQNDDLKNTRVVSVVECGENKSIESITEYDEHGRQYKHTEFYHGQENSQITKYDENGQKVYEKDLTNEEIHYMYNDKGLLISEVKIYTNDPDDPTKTFIVPTIYEYDSNGNCIRELSVEGRGKTLRVEREFDSSNRIISNIGFLSTGSIITEKTSYEPLEDDRTRAVILYEDYYPEDEKLSCEGEIYKIFDKDWNLESYQQLMRDKDTGELCEFYSFNNKEKDDESLFIEERDSNNRITKRINRNYPDTIYMYLYQDSREPFENIYGLSVGEEVRPWKNDEEE